MTSSINYTTINENFPVAGQDNDTQTFRDNYNVIKTNFRYAKEEIDDLQNTSAKLNSDNNFNGNLLQNGVLTNISNAVNKFGPLTGSVELDYSSAPYQYVPIEGNLEISFVNLPQTELTVGKMIVELVSTVEEPVTITFQYPSEITKIRVNSDWPSPFSITTTDPIFLEAWIYNGVLFLNYQGSYVDITEI